MEQQTRRKHKYALLLVTVRPCSTCLSRSQARLCLYTLRMISNHTERTFGRLRYLLGGDRPSQTAHLTLSPSTFSAAG